MAGTCAEKSCDIFQLACRYFFVITRSLPKHKRKGIETPIVARVVLSLLTVLYFPALYAKYQNLGELPPEHEKNLYKGHLAEWKFYEDVVCDPLASLIYSQPQIGGDFRQCEEECLKSTQHCNLFTVGVGTDPRDRVTYKKAYCQLFERCDGRAWKGFNTYAKPKAHVDPPPNDLDLQILAPVPANLVAIFVKQLTGVATLGMIGGAIWNGIRYSFALDWVRWSIILLVVFNALVLVITLFKLIEAMALADDQDEAEAGYSQLPGNTQPKTQTPVVVVPTNAPTYVKSQPPVTVVETVIEVPPARIQAEPLQPVRPPVGTLQAPAAPLQPPAATQPVKQTSASSYVMPSLVAQPPQTGSVLPSQYKPSIVSPAAQPVQPVVASQGASYAMPTLIAEPPRPAIVTQPSQTVVVAEPLQLPTPQGHSYEMPGILTEVRPTTEPAYGLPVPEGGPELRESMDGDGGIMLSLDLTQYRGLDEKA